MRSLVVRVWVEASTRQHARIDDQSEYGYLWWMRTFTSRDRPYRAFFVSGIGGNKVLVSPDAGLVVVVTTTNFRERDAHALTGRLLVDPVLAAVEPPAGALRSNAPNR